MNYFYNKKRNREVVRYFDEEKLESWGVFNAKTFGEGKLSKKVKELVAAGCAYITRCPYCIEAHAKKAHEAGASEELADVMQSQLLSTRERPWLT